MTKLHVDRRVGLWSESVSRGKPARVGALLLVVTLSTMGLILVAPPAAGDVVDPYIATFSAAPGFVNLNMTTSVDVTLGLSRGPGLDNYLATIEKPDGSNATAWFNFTTGPAIRIVIVAVLAGVALAYAYSLFQVIQIRNKGSPTGRTPDPAERRKDGSP